MHGVKFFATFFTLCSIILNTKAQDKVGIRTSTPNAALHVRNNSGAGFTNPHLMLEEQNDAGDGARLAFTNQLVGGRAWIVYGKTASLNTDARLNFWYSNYGDILSLHGNGRIGVNTNAPTATLDVNGTIRIRDNAGWGRILVSQAFGRAEWQAAVAFQKRGFKQGCDNVQIATVRNKVMFDSNPQYNYGGHYDGTNSTFTAPMKGLYHFDACVLVYWTKDSLNIYLAILRNGEKITMAVSNIAAGASFEGPFQDVRRTATISTDCVLEKGDIVYIDYQHWQTDFAHRKQGSALTRLLSFR
jgi:hypothetical protein